MKCMKKNILHSLLKFQIGLTVIVLETLITPEYSFGQFRTRFMDLHIEGLSAPAIESNTNYSTNQYGIGANLSAGGKMFNLVLEYNYNQVDITNSQTNLKTSINFSEWYMGIRYYPIRPTAIIGNTALRLTAGYLYGFDMEPNWRSLLIGGIAFSSVRNASGVSVNFVYRPETVTIKTYNFQPSYSLRVAFVLGPKA